MDCTNDKIIPAFGAQQVYAGAGSCGCGCGGGSSAGSIPGWFYLVLLGGALIATSK